MVGDVTAFFMLKTPTPGGLLEEDTVDTVSIKKKLLQLKAELIDLDEASHAGTQPVALDQSSVGRLSRMDAMQVQAMSLETKRRREIQIQRIEGALKRIENDAYGYCVTCDEVIDPKRLDFDLTAFLCIHCASAAEQ